MTKENEIIDTEYRFRLWGSASIEDAKVWYDELRNAGFDVEHSSFAPIVGLNSERELVRAIKFLQLLPGNQEKLRILIEKYKL